MNLNLKDKVVVITGGSKGIGFATAQAFLEEGAKIAICARKEEDLKKAYEDLSRLGEVYYEVVDVTNSKQVYDFAEHVHQHYGVLDVWVNNAGNSGYKKGEEYDDEEIDFITNLIFKSVVYGCQAAFRYMKQNGGAIVNVASLGGRCATSGKASLYGPLKSAVMNLTNTLAGEYAAWNVRVTCVMPGFIATERSVKSVGAAKLQSNIATTILRRPGRPEEIAKPIVFLASDAASFMTATSVEVSGGRCMTLNPLFSYEKKEAEERGESISSYEARV
ncbi:MAG: SDR family oxidoreductase [Lachnospiraceae bacterium]|nr:SDR family oxidoreductase [Lachnospiraceae bacterium]